MLDYVEKWLHLLSQLIIKLGNFFVDIDYALKKFW
jgi:hypothetical protein